MRLIFALAVVFSFASACCMPVYGGPAQTEPTEKQVLSKPLKDDLKLVVTEQRMVVAEKPPSPPKRATTGPGDGDEADEVHLIVKYHYRFDLVPAGGGGDRREVFSFDAYDLGKYGFGPFRPATVLDAILVSDLLIVLYREDVRTHAALVGTKSGKDGEVPLALTDQTLYKDYVGGGKFVVGGKLELSSRTEPVRATIEIQAPEHFEDRGPYHFVLDLDKAEYKWQKAD